MNMKYGVTCLAMICSQTIFAGVTITGTRIIFPSNQNSVTVQLNNPLETPALIQAWLDNGDPGSIPEAEKIPFILTPPLTQIDPKKGQMIRLISKDTKNLAKDRESLYWFNILDIPPTDTTSSEQSKLQVSIRSRIKLFYRPVSLNMTQQKAFSEIKFNYDASKAAITVNNPSPYYINFYDLTFNPEKENTVYNDPLMVAPFSSETFKPAIHAKPTQIKYSLINDYGANQIFTTTLENVE